MKKPFLSVIIPAYNEEARIPQTLLSIDAYLSRMAYSYEILVIDDGSADKTVAVVEAMAKRIRHLIVVKNPKNKGKGGVVRQGMLLATGDMRLFTDADNSTSIDQVVRMLPYLEKGYDVVIGSRAIAGARLDPPEPWYRELAGRGLNRIVQFLLLPGISDTQCGFKLFTEDAAIKVFSDATVSGWGFDVEVLALAKKSEYAIKEVPVHWKNSDGSHVTSSAGFQFLRDVAKVRWRL